ncbi:MULTISPECIES: hypothetical protein [unclassified Spirosoma]|uniref:hypothetical protein n=1 Tax=unclassified Spirosoma TaxID=2621999 RepID=UPI00096780C9|nr:MULTISPECIES: hypothetical protein [unclassified Spirosoma]MBN8824438.1 hypothetical protein [Spirosoma sp.]OJW70099.1 MAG: hypothetical protein BGO59_25835 [Spirosoma sp. 48-14]
MQPTPLRFRKGNPNVLAINLSRYVGGSTVAVVPTQSLLLFVELRQSENINPVTVPLLKPGQTNELAAVLPDLNVGTYLMTVKVVPSVGSPYRYALPKVTYISPGSPETIRDVQGVSVTVDESHKVIDAVMDATPATGLVMSYAQFAQQAAQQVSEGLEAVADQLEQATESAATITGAIETCTGAAAAAQQSAGSAQSSKQAAHDSQVAAAGSAQTATEQAGVATGAAQQAQTLVGNILAFISMDAYAIKMGIGGNIQIENHPEAHYPYMKVKFLS